MKNFQKIATGVDVSQLHAELERQPGLWNRHQARLFKNGPHSQTSDIWLRYKDEAENKASGDYRNFNDPHESVWYPGARALPEARRLIFWLLPLIEGERIGGALIYKIPPGKEILPHIDTGWHVEYYDKFNIAIKSQPGVSFFYKDSEPMTTVTGDVHQFVNNKVHWVKNESDEDHIVMTVCVRTAKYGYGCDVLKEAA